MMRFALLLFSGCCAVSQAGVQLQPEAIEITLPHIDAAPAPCPDPLDQPTPTISPDTILVVKSNVPLIALQSPTGLLKITTETGPLRIRGKFADGDGKIETRNYSAKYLVFIDAEKPGQTELLLVPHGVTKESDIVRQLLIVSGEGPRPPPGPGPGPEPKPEPQPVVVKNVRISVITDADQITVEQAVVLNALVGWNALQDAGNEYRLYDAKTEEPDGKKAIEQLNGPLPGIVYTDKASGKVLKYGPIPATFDDLKTIVKELTGG